VDADTKDNSILIKKTNQCEKDAYEHVFSDSRTDPRLEADIEFRKFIPRYYG